MKTKSEIDAEIKALKALKPVGKFAAKTKNSIGLMIEELEYGVDDTAAEWNELTDDERLSVMDARQWKEGVRSERPSQGWGALVGGNGGYS